MTTRVLLLNPAAPDGCTVIRSYSGGYGDVIEPSHDVRILFPPLELLRMAAVFRDAGIKPYVVDHQANPISPLPDQADLVITFCSLPTIATDSEAHASAMKRYGNCRGFLFTSVRSQAFWSRAVELSGAEAILLPEMIPMIDRLATGQDLGGFLAAHPTVEIVDAKAFLDPESEPIPALDLLDLQPYVFSPFIEANAPDQPIVILHASAGCPYPCGYFCPYPLAEGKRYRPKSTTRVVAEMLASKKQGAVAVVFRDPVFTFDRKRTLELCYAIECAGLGMPWWCETRIDRLDHEVLERMVDAGCVGIEVGVESGDDKILQGSARKNIRTEQVVEFNRMAIELGVVVHYLFILGLPGEGRRNISNTLSFILELQIPPSRVNLSIITPYPGTPFHRDAVTAGWIEREMDSFTGYSVVMRTDKLDASELAEAERLGESMKKIAGLRGELAIEEWESCANEFRKKLSNWVESGPNG